MIRLFEHTGRVDVVLGRKRAFILNAFLRNDRRLRGHETLNPSGWQVLSSFSTAAFLTARIYLFHRKLYEILALVAVHDPVIEVGRNGGESRTISFSRADTEGDTASGGEMGA